MTAFTFGACRLYFRHMLDALRKIGEYTAVGRDGFLAGPHWQDATIRQLEILGEAAKKVSAELRNRHPDISWRRVAGLRDVLIHNYMGVDLNAVWEAADHHGRDLELKIRAILAVLP